jgi:pimeloyl-ACP methyl ester carboxylesterase
VVANNAGVPLAFDDCGVGAPTVMLVHGWSCDRSYWAGQIAALRARHRVVNIDLGGHGESGRNRGDWSMAAFASDVVTVADHLALNDLVLVGHSSGGNVSLEAARALPHRVRGLVWADCCRRLEGHASAEQVERRLLPLRARFADETRRFVHGMFPARADAALVERVAQGMSGAPPEIALPALAATWHYERDAAAAVRALGLPIVAINPDDGSTDIASLQSYGVQVMMLPRTGHFLMMEDADGFNALLMRALQQLDRWPR